MVVFFFRLASNKEKEGGGAKKLYTVSAFSNKKKLSALWKKISWLEPLSLCDSSMDKEFLRTYHYYICCLFWWFCFFPPPGRTDLLHVLSSLPRYLNFIEHTSDIGWKEYVKHLPNSIDRFFNPSFLSIARYNTYRCCKTDCLVQTPLCRYQRAKPVIIDPGLYKLQKSDVFWITEKRSVPTAFKLFTGEPSSSA